MNWNQVCNGGATYAALALADVTRHADAAQRALGYAADGIPYAISGYGPDAATGGAWPEGSGYWNYITKWLLATSEALVTATGNDNGYMETPGVSRTGDFALQMYFTPSGDVFNYGDTPDGPADIGIASNLLGLAARFPQMGKAAVTAAHTAARPPALDAGGWDDVVLALMRWAPPMAPSGPSKIDDLPLFSFYTAQAVGVVRSGWARTDSYLAARGGNATVTHQDLDHGTFVWETRGYRWIDDLGTENYGLPNMFLPFEGRYRYYRKSTRGHNTLAFGDPGGFDPATAELSDQAVNTFSTLSPGSGCNRTLGDYVCRGKEVMVVNLTDAYAPQLPNGLPDPNSPLSSRPVVLRTFAVDKKMTQLVITDSINNSRKNVTWGVHTRATKIVLRNNRAILAAPNGLRIEASLESTPTGVCGRWQSTLINLPNGTAHNETRFPLYGAKKVWVTCDSSVRTVRVTFNDL